MNEIELRLVRSILNSPVASDLRTDVCDNLCELFGLTSSCFVVIDKDDPRNRQIIGCKSFHKAMANPEYYALCEGSRDLYSTAYRAIAERDECEFSGSLDIFPKSRHAEYVELCDRVESITGAAQEAGAHFGLTERFNGLIALHLPRATDMATFLSDARLNQFAGLIADAYQVSAVFEALRNRYRAVLSVLDRLLLGVALVDQKRRTLVSNERWHEITNKIPSIRNRAGVLECDGALRSTIANAFNAYRGNPRLARNTIVEVSDGINADRYAALIHPLHVTREEFDHDANTVAILMIDTQDNRLPSVDLSTQVLALTPAERETLRHLVDGLTYRDVSDMRSVSLDTTKAHVKSIFDKAGCRRLPELMLKIARLDTPFDFN